MDTKMKLKKLVMPGNDSAQVHPLGPALSPALLSISSTGKLSPALLSVNSVSSPKALLANPQAMFNTSMASLSPSQLDHAIMEMLNIRPQHNRCDANPITKSGKRLQLIQMLGLALCPVLLLLASTAFLFATNLQNKLSSTQVAATLSLGVEISTVIHHLQKERDISAMYVSAIGPATKERLIACYPATDQAVQALSRWPDPHSASSSVQATSLTSKQAFIRFLNKHRYSLDVLPALTSLGELAFYSSLIHALTDAMHAAITENQTTGSVWKDLVSLVEVQAAKESFGVERAYGVIFYVNGGFETAEEYVHFTEAQDVANESLFIANEYSDVTAAIHARIVHADSPFATTIRTLRYEIRNTPFGGDNDIERSDTRALLWFDNMTMYLDALLVIQKELSTHIMDVLSEQQRNTSQGLVIYGLLFGAVLLFCPVLMYAVTQQTAQIQDYSMTLAARTKALNSERNRTNVLLYRMLPRSVAEQLKREEPVSAESFNEVTVFLSDMVGFTSICSESSPIQVVQMLNTMYTAFDERIALYDVYKVETIGDAYMVASGLPLRNADRHASEIASLSLDLLRRVQHMRIPHMPGRKYRLRIGVHSGSVIAGVVGNKMPRYCLFGATVQIAAQMESTGKVGKVHISEATHRILDRTGNFIMLKRDDTADLDLPFDTFWLLHREGTKQCLSRTSLTSLTDSNVTHGEPASPSIEFTSPMASSNSTMKSM